MKPLNDDQILNNLKDLHPNELLIKSARNGFLKGVQMALNNGADIHYQNDWPLRFASHNGHTDIVKLLIDNGSDIHANNDQALHLASKYGHTDTVKLLIDHGADIHAINDNALRYATRNGHTDIVNLLKQYGSTLNESIGKYSEAEVLYKRTLAILEINPETQQTLIDEGAKSIGQEAGKAA